MSDLVTWIRAQLDIDERDIRGSRGLTPGELHWSMPDWLDEDRLLAEVEAKRRILDLHALEVASVRAAPFDPMTGEANPEWWSVGCVVCGWVTEDPTSACQTLRLLALPYATRDGYREEWRP